MDTEKNESERFCGENEDPRSNPLAELTIASSGTRSPHASSKSPRGLTSCRSSSTDRRIEVRRGGTLLGAAMKNGVRLMHVCGARTLCATCRVVVESGEDNLTPMRGTEKFSLRWHLSVSPRTRLACQARVNGPVEVESVFPLCGELPNG